MMRRTAIVLGVMVFLCTLFVTSDCGQAIAATQNAADFYKGKTVEFMCNGRAGGSEFLLVQTLLPKLSAATGATFVMNNIASDTGVEGLNRVWIAKPDGLIIGLDTFAATVSLDLFNEPGSLTQIDKVTFLGGVARDISVFWVKADGPYNTVDKIITAKNIKFASVAPM